MSYRCTRFICWLGVSLGSGLGCAGSAPDSDLLGLPHLPPVASPSDSARAVVADPESGFGRGVWIFPGTVPLSFEDVAVDLLESHPELEAARQRVMASEADRLQSRAWTNPTLQGEIEGWGLDRDGLDESEVTLSAVFPLDLAGQRGTRVARAEAERDAARARYREARRVLLGRARDAVHAVRAARERERLASERLRVTEETAAAVTREVDSGKAPPLEAIRAAGDRERARADVAASRAASRAARLHLGSLLGKPGQEVDIAGRLREAPVSANLDGWRRELQTHPAYVASAWDGEAARRRVREVSRSRWPSVGAEVGVRRYVAEDRSAWVTGLGIELPLWDRRAQAMQGARYEASAAQADLDNLARSLATELEFLTTRLGETQGRLALYRDEILPRARDALAIARVGFDEGKFGYLELLDAQRALLDVESGHSEALIAYDETLGRLESLLDREPTVGLVPEVP